MQRKMHGPATRPALWPLLLYPGCSHMLMLMHKPFRSIKELFAEGGVTLWASEWAASAAGASLGAQWVGGGGVTFEVFAVGGAGL